MAERISLTDAADHLFNEAIHTAVRYLSAGEVIIVAAEFGYIYLANAFDKDAVKAIHILRGDQSGVAAQVLVSDQKVLAGITTALTTEQESLLSKFWPGLLSVTIKSQPTLSWDLGDERKLGRINIRVPNRRFLTAVLAKSGPLAAASVSIAGKEVILDLAKLPIYESDVGAIFDEAVLQSGPASTWIEINENEVTVKRVGAISVAQLQGVIPTISAPNL